MNATAAGRGAAEMIPIEHETTDRVVRTLVFAVPPAALAAAGWLAWGGTLHWQDLLVLAITYTLTGLGVTVGYPTSARHGLGRWQLDPSAWLIGGLERCHLAWNVVRISPVRQQDKRRPTTA